MDGNDHDGLEQAGSTACINGDWKENESLALHSGCLCAEILSYTRNHRQLFNETDQMSMRILN